MVALFAVTAEVDRYESLFEASKSWSKMKSYNFYNDLQMILKIIVQHNFTNSNKCTSCT